MVQWLRALTLNTGSLTAMVQASLGVHVRCQVLSRYVRWFFCGYSRFHPPLINDRLDISEIFLKEPYKTQIFIFSYFSTKRYVVIPHVTVLMVGHKYVFMEKYG